MKKLTTLIALLALSAAACFGQAALASTTLGAALTTTATTVTLTSTSTMLNSGVANRINTVLYTDKEFMQVTTVVDSTHVIVRRGQGIGASARPESHNSGAKVYFANTTVNAPASSYFNINSSEASGSCTSTNELVLPRVYLFTGNIYNCLSSGQWFMVGNGTMNTGGQNGRISAFCTGTAGSAETEYLNSAACSGATTLTARQLVTVPGVLANLYVVSSAAFTGGTSKDVLTVFKNGSATAITCTAIATATTCSDTTHSVAVVPGDVIAFQFVSATSDTAANVSAAVGLY